MKSTGKRANLRDLGRVGAGSLRPAPDGAHLIYRLMQAAAGAQGARAAATGPWASRAMTPRISAARSLDAWLQVVSTP